MRVAYEDIRHIPKGELTRELVMNEMNDDVEEDSMAQDVGSDGKDRSREGTRMPELSNVPRTHDEGGIQSAQEDVEAGQRTGDYSPRKG